MDILRDKMLGLLHKCKMDILTNDDCSDIVRLKRV